MLEKLLIERKEAVRDRWFQLIVNTYPADSADFLRDQKDRFQNPVGHTLVSATRVLLDRFLDRVEPEELVDPLDEIVKIRSVQEFTASQAVGFIFLLKQASREALTDEDWQGVSIGALLEFDARIDSLVLTAFDVFMKWRERTYEIRAGELRCRTNLLLEKTNYFVSPEPRSDEKPKDDTLPIV